MKRNTDLDAGDALLQRVFGKPATPTPVLRPIPKALKLRLTDKDQTVKLPRDPQWLKVARKKT